MYLASIKSKTDYDFKKIGEFNDLEKAQEKIEAELAKNNELKYVIEEITGAVDVYGELITRVVEKN